MRVLLLTGQHTNYPGKWPIFDFENGWPILYFKGMKTQKYMFFLYYVKIGVENEFEIRFVQFDLRRKSAFSTEIPFPVKTIARSRDVSGRTIVLRNTYSLVELVWELV